MGFFSNPVMLFALLSFPAGLLAGIAAKKRGISVEGAIAIALVVVVVVFPSLVIVGLAVGLGLLGVEK